MLQHSSAYKKGRLIFPLFAHISSWINQVLTSGTGIGAFKSVLMLTAVAEGRATVAAAAAQQHFEPRQRLNRSFFRQQSIPPFALPLHYQEIRRDCTVFLSLRTLSLGSRYKLSRVCKEATAVFSGCIHFSIQFPSSEAVTKIDGSLIVLSTRGLNVFNKVRWRSRSTVPSQLQPTRAAML